MLQHIYAVQVVDKSSGREDVIRVWADSPEAAADLAADDSRIVGTARLIEIRPASAAADESVGSGSLVVDELRAIRVRLAQVTDARMLARPRFTIAEGVLLGFAYLFIISLGLSLIGGIFQIRF